MSSTSCAALWQPTPSDNVGMVRSSSAARVASVVCVGTDHDRAVASKMSVCSKQYAEAVEQVAKPGRVDFGCAIEPQPPHLHRYKPRAGTLTAPRANVDQ